MWRGVCRIGRGYRRIETVTSAEVPNPVLSLPPGLGSGVTGKVKKRPTMCGGFLLPIGTS